eukprot:2119340-Alexandrium_andersonii.AAC.1
MARRFLSVKSRRRLLPGGSFIDRANVGTSQLGWGNSSRMRALGALREGSGNSGVHTAFTECRCRHHHLCFRYSHDLLLSLIHI